VSSVDTRALALASISHSPAMAPEPQWCCSIMLLGRGFELVGVLTRQGGRILAVKGWSRCAVAGDGGCGRNVRAGRVYLGMSRDGGGCG
jgi:hypothetical protein